jgi:hypothetical protein
MISVADLWGAALQTLGVLFVAHKIEGRVPLFGPKNSMALSPCTDWKCDVPGLIVSHQRLTNVQALFIVPLYIAAAAFVVRWMRGQLRPDHPPPWSLKLACLLLLSWAAFENHHSAYTDMPLSHMFVSYTFQFFLPATLLLISGHPGAGQPLLTAPVVGFAGRTPRCAIDR